jgi:phospholipid transport system substrate-binding protein
MNILMKIIGLLCLGFTLTAAAQELAPEQLVQKVTEEVLAAIQSDRQLAAGDKQKALKLAEEKVLPYIDFEEATRLAVGRAWSQATPEQRKKLVAEFRNMLVRTYSNAIESYEGQTLKVLPSRGGKQAAGNDEATVRV